MHPGLLMMLACLIAGPSAAAEDVRGDVALAGHGGARCAVVWLEGEVKSRPMPPVAIDQRNKTFIPHVTVVTVGTRVDFPNNDTVFHNVFAYFRAKKFDLGMYPRGASKHETFDKTGLVALLCNVHPDMSAYIMVVDTPFHAVTDKQGRFHIEGVPPGIYTLHGWHESGAETSEPLIVKSGMDSAPLHVALARK